MSCFKADDDICRWRRTHSSQTILVMYLLKKDKSAKCDQKVSQYKGMIQNTKKKIIFF